MKFARTVLGPEELTADKTQNISKHLEQILFFSSRIKCSFIMTWENLQAIRGGGGGVKYFLKTTGKRQILTPW